MAHQQDGQLTLEEFKKDRQRLKELVKIVDGDLAIKMPHYGTYDIPLNEIDSKAKILYWVLHLSEKMWATTEIISCVITVASQYNQIDPYSRK